MKYAEMKKLGERRITRDTDFCEMQRSFVAYVKTLDDDEWEDFRGAVANDIPQHLPVIEMIRKQSFGNAVRDLKLLAQANHFVQTVLESK